MSTTTQKLLFSFLLLSVILVTANSKNFLGNDKPTSPAVHPFDILPNKLAELEWDDQRIDEHTRKYWNEERSFMGRPKDNKPRLSTSCLHTAAWIVQGLLELEKRPNYYIGKFKKVEDESLVVYDNTARPPERSPVPAIQSMRKFIEARPSDESIVFQIDLYEVLSAPSHYYVDHHIAVHFYDGQVNVYHNWQDVFNLIDWMSKPETHKMRYPMPMDTWFELLEKALTYTEDEEGNRVRYEAIWRLFGITDTFVFGEKKDLDPIVRRLSYPWVMSYISHWPHTVQPGN